MCEIGKEKNIDHPGEIFTEPGLKMVFCFSYVAVARTQNLGEKNGQLGPKRVVRGALG